MRILIGLALAGVVAACGGEVSGPATATAVSPVVMWEGNFGQLAGSYDSATETLSLTTATRAVLAEKSLTLRLAETQTAIDLEAKQALHNGSTINVDAADGTTVARLVVETQAFIDGLPEAQASTSFLPNPNDDCMTLQ